MNKITKAFGIIALLILSMVSIALPTLATLDPLGIKVNDVKVDGNSLTGNQTIQTQFERDSELSLNVQLQTDGSTTVSDVQVQAFISGSKDPISDSTSLFNVNPNTVYTKTLKLTLPQRVADRQYQLRVVVTSPNSNTISYVYPLEISAPSNQIAIKDVVFSPNDKVLAGRAFTATARLKNYGDKDANDVKVVVSLPELNVQETSYINNINKDDTVSSDEMLLRVPANAKTGDYTVQIAVYYNDYDDKTTQNFVMHVDGSDVAQSAGSLSGKTTISVGVQEQTVARGENGVIFPLTLTNGATSAKTYTLTVSGANDWAVTKVSPSNVVILNAGETKQAYVYVAANENSALGDHVFSVDVNVDGNTVQQIPMKAVVLESTSSNAWNGVKSALTAGVILLVVLIVILGAVVLYQRTRKTDSIKEDEQIAQTYY